MKTESQERIARLSQTLLKAAKELDQEVAEVKEQHLFKPASGCFQTGQELGMFLNNRRKALGLDFETLELQSDLSGSTLRRICKDPDSVKFSSIRTVAELLGVNLCAV